MLCTPAQFIQHFQDAPHGSIILNENRRKLLRMLRTGARLSSTFSAFFARERDFIQNVEDAPHGSAMLNIFSMLRKGKQLHSKISGCSALERDFIQNFEAAAHGGEMLNIFSMLRTGEQFQKIQDALHRSAILNKMSM